MVANQSVSGGEAKHHKAEGPQKHIIVYILSLALTIIAFAAVAAGGISDAFTYTILVIMAIVQAFSQMAFWMHMKDRGHLFPVIAIISGVVVAFLMVILAIYWCWW
jgi:cytochrome c oxidase subunit 4